MKLNVAWLTLACLCLSSQAHAQSVVYSLSYTDNGPGLRARLANAPLPTRTPDQNLELLRNTLKTEIYAVSIADGKRTLLFSDEGPHLELQATGAVTRTGKAYFLAFLRNWHGQPSPGIQADRAYFEIDLDGSNRFRKIADAPAVEGPAVLNPQETRAVVQGPNAYLVYSVPDWKLLASWNLSKVTGAHCPACSPGSYGWLADGERLYFDLGVFTDETEEEHESDHPGVYIVSASGSDLGAIPPQTGAFQFPGYVHELSDRLFLGQLMDGRYLFLDYGMKERPKILRNVPFVVISNSNTTPQRVVPLKFPVGGPVSPSGRYMAYLESRQTENYRTHVWVKDLESGEDKELLAGPPPTSPNSTEPNVALSILGWIEK